MALSGRGRCPRGRARGLAVRLGPAPEFWLVRTPRVVAGDLRGLPQRCRSGRVRWQSQARYVRSLM